MRRDISTAINIVARINLPNMRYESEQRVEIYLRAPEGLVQLEPDPNKRLKYIDFVAQYAISPQQLT